MISKIIYYASENGCPFCQEKNCNIVKTSRSATEELQVECNDCGARGPISLNEEQAKECWELGRWGINGRMRKL